MMIYLAIRQTIGEYARWKEAFDNHLAARQAGGATREALLLRNVDDPHEIIVILGWHNLAQARMFTQSVSWQVALKKMGVVGVPEVWFLQEVKKIPTTGHLKDQASAEGYSPIIFSREA